MVSRPLEPRSGVETPMGSAAPRNARFPNSVRSGIFIALGPPPFAQGLNPVGAASGWAIVQAVLRTVLHQPFDFGSADVTPTGFHLRVRGVSAIL